MNKFSIENFKDSSSTKENAGKKQLFSLSKKTNNSTISKSNSLDSYDPNGNSKCLSDCGSIELKKNYDNCMDSKDILDIKDTNEANNNINLFGKKTKVSFCIKKQTKQKSRYKNDNVNLFFKKRQKKEKQRICSKKKLFQAYKLFYKDDSIKNTNGANGGRWSYEEHIKFIESFVNYGKKWNIIQKYIGTRSCKQIISHAQKFFLRLKRLNTDNYNFNFRKNNIQSLSNIINVIAKSNNTRKNDKKYIIDTLIDLTDLNLKTRRKKYFKRKKYKFITKTQKELAANDKISKINDELLNKTIINNKNLEFDDIISDLIKDKAEDEFIIPDKNSHLEEKDINKDNLLQLKEKEKENNTIHNNKINNGQNNNSNNEYLDNTIDQNFIGDNNSLLISDSSKFYDIDSISIELMNNVIKKNIIYHLDK